MILTIGTTISNNYMVIRLYDATTIGILLQRRHLINNLLRHAYRVNLTVIKEKICQFLIIKRELVLNRDFSAKRQTQNYLPTLHYYIVCINMKKKTHIQKVLYEKF